VRVVAEYFAKMPKGNTGTFLAELLTARSAKRPPAARAAE
jgi:hypothetical protein